MPDFGSFFEEKEDVVSGQATVVDDSPDGILQSVAALDKNITQSNRPLPNMPQQIREASTPSARMTHGDLERDMLNFLATAGADVEQPAPPELPSMGELILSDLQETQSTFFSDVDAGLGAAVRGNIVNVMKVTKLLRENTPFGMEGFGSPFLTGISNESLDFVIEKLETAEELDTADRTIIGGMIKVMSEFVTNFMVAKKITGIQTPWATVLGLGTAAELMTFPHDDPRLSNMVRDFLLDAELPDNVAMDLTKSALDFLASDPDDGLAEGLFTQSIEGVITGGLFEVAGRGIGAGLARFKQVMKLMREKRIAASIGTSPSTKAMPVSVGNGTVDSQASQIANVLVEQVRGVKITKITEKGVSGTPTPTQAMELKVNAITETFEASLRKINANADNALDEFNIGKKVEWFRNRAKHALEKNVSFIPKGIGAENISRMYDKSLKASKEKLVNAASSALKKLEDMWERGIVDRSGPVKRALLRSAGDDGEKAVEKLVLAQGATERGALRFREAREEIFGGLGVFNSKDRDALNEYIQMRNLAHIKMRKPDFITPYDVGKEKSSQFDFENVQELMRERLGPETFADIERRADLYFDVMRKNVKEMEANGLISSTDTEKIIAFDHSPLEFITEQIDHSFTIELPGKKTVSVTESGIDRLGKGSRKRLEDDAEYLLAQVLLRSQGRIVRNNMNLQLKRVAESHPDNPVVRLKKPKGERDEWTQISYREGGEEKHLFIQKEFAEQWITDTHMMPKLLDTILRSASFSWLVRPFATGINPEFPLSNLPRDLALVWFSTKEYSAALPKALAQLSVDMVEVAGDAMKRGDLFKQYIENGGGMSLLSHQGRLGDPTAISSRLQKVQHVVGYLNETSEIWVRLALMNRAIKNGKTVEEATFIARTYLDFSQGGYITKAIDTMVPYTNAGTQALRSMFRAAKKDPKVFGMKIAQAAAAYGMMNMANRAQNREGFAQVPTDVLHRNMVMMTGHSFEDQEGNRRYLYLKIPIDQSLAPMKALVEATMARFYDGKVPDNATLDLISSFGQAVPIGNMPPSMSAIIAIAANHDYWSNRKIWPQDNILPGQETNRIPDPTTGVLTRQPGEKLTSAFAEDLGGLLPKELSASSPARIDVALRSVAPRNLYTDTMGLAYEALFDQVPQEVKDQSTVEMLARMPFLRRYLGITHPAATGIEDLINAKREEVGNRRTIESEVDDMFFRVQRREISEKVLLKWINSHDPITRKQLGVRVDNQKQIHKYRKLFQIPGVPKRDIWITLMTLPPSVKAIKILDFIENTDGWDNRGQQIRAIKTLWRNLPGLRTPETRKALVKEIELRGLKGASQFVLFP